LDVLSYYSEKEFFFIGKTRIELAEDETSYSAYDDNVDKILSLPRDDRETVELSVTGVSNESEIEVLPPDEYAMEELM